MVEITPRKDKKQEHTREKMNKPQQTPKVQPIVPHAKKGIGENRDKRRETNGVIQENPERETSRGI